MWKNIFQLIYFIKYDIGVFFFPPFLFLFILKTMKDNENIQIGNYHSKAYKVYKALITGILNLFYYSNTYK